MNREALRGSRPTLLATIVVIPTVLNYFLQKEIERKQDEAKSAGWEMEALLTPPRTEKQRSKRGMGSG